MDPLSLDKPLKIDMRPMWQIVLDRTTRYQVLALLAAVVAVVYQLSPPTGLSANGYHALILFGATIFLWVSGLLPIAVTSLLAMVMLPICGIMSEKQAFSLFGNEAVFFILGAFILAAAMTGTGLSARLARFMLVRFGSTPLRLAWTLFLLAAGLSFCMSEHAVAAMLFPVVTEIVESLGGKPGKSNYAKLLLMSIAWGCIIGGIATFLGGARAPLAASMLRESRGLDFTFAEWTSAALMIVIPLLVVGFVVLLKFFPIDVTSVENGRLFLNRKRLEVGRVSANELITALIVTLTIGGWMFFGKQLGLATVAILATAALFVFRVVTWQMIEEYV
ncbi:MAG: anion permease, partial [Steroidobacteraceae bacterium]|nr:anion permease [Deltaproteobacteria bacterium]